MTVVIDGTTGIDTVQDGTVAPADLTTGAPSWNSAGNLSFNSGYGSVATAYGCRAWVNFNGTGTVAIRGSGNVTSITDNGVGIYTVNITNALPDINYSCIVTKQNTTTNVDAYGSDAFAARATTSVQIYTLENNASQDTNNCNVSIYR